MDILEKKNDETYIMQGLKLDYMGIVLKYIHSPNKKAFFIKLYTH